MDNVLVVQSQNYNERIQVWSLGVTVQDGISPACSPRPWRPGMLPCNGPVHAVLLLDDSLVVEERLFCFHLGCLSTIQNMETKQI